MRPRARRGRQGLRAALAAGLLLAAAAGCGGGRGVRGPGPDPDMANRARAAARLFRAGRAAEAAPLFAAALDRARSLDDPKAAGVLAYDLAACLFEAGDLAGAQARALEAEAALERAGRPADHVMLLRARILLARGRAGEAEGLARAALAATRRRETRVMAHLVLFRAAAEAGRGSDAAAVVASARELVPSSAGPALRAAVAAAEGDAALAAGDALAAGGRFEAEAAAWSVDRRPARVARALERACAAYAAGGAGDAAAAAGYRAARSWRGQGRAGRAAAALDAAAAAPGIGREQRARLDALRDEWAAASP